MYVSDLSLILIKSVVDLHAVSVVLCNGSCFLAELASEVAKVGGFCLSFI